MSRPWWDYAPAPLDESLANARGMLARLYQRELRLLETVDHGTCDDCHRDSDRVRYGQVLICACCASHRWKVADAA